MIEVYQDYSIIKDCYKLKNDNEIYIKVINMSFKRLKKRYSLKRSIDSYFNEVKAHRRLYNLHIMRSHTKDVDLEENTKLFYEFIWWVLSR